MIINNMQITKKDMELLNETLKETISNIESGDPEKNLYKLKIMQKNLNENLELDKHYEDIERGFKNGR